MIPPYLDFTSEQFDAYEALHSDEVYLPHPKVKTYNNLAEYYSLFFLKKGLEFHKPSKNTVKPRARDYEWYYDTLGLNEHQKDVSRAKKKIKHRKGKKPVSIVTIPSSPLKSDKITVCQSDFKNYWKRKYRSFNTSRSTETDSKQFEISKSEPTELSIPLCFVKTELPAPFVIKTENDDSIPDNVLIYKMRSNLFKVNPKINLNEFAVSFQIKDEQLELALKSKQINDVYQVKKQKHFSKSSKTTSNDRVLNSGCNVKCSITTSNSKNAPSVQQSTVSFDNQKKGSRKRKITSDDKLKSQKKIKIFKEEKKERCVKNKKDNSRVTIGQPEKPAAQNLSCDKTSALSKENSSVSKSNIRNTKKHRKGALKPQENVLEVKNYSAASESKINGVVSKTKTESSPVANHCTCKFPCGLSHLCTCGYFASAKEVLSKFKIPRKKK